MAANYRLLYGGLRSGQIIGELPVVSFSFSKVLNGAGELTADIPLNTEDKIQAQNFTPARTTLFVERDGVIVWAGILWGYRMNVASNSLEASAQELWSYFHHRHLTVDKTYVQVDQADIARDLLTWAQSVNGGNINVAMGTEVHGINRDRSWLWQDTKNIGEAVEDLAAVIGGFDFYIDSRWSGDLSEVTHTFRTMYPARGRLTDHVFDMDANAELMDTQVDGSSMVNEAWTLGATQDDADPPYAVRRQLYMLEADYPLLQSVDTDTDVTNPATLVAKSDRTLLRGKVPVTQITLALVPHLPPTLGSYIVGDRVRVRGDYGLLEVDDTFRIVELRVGLDASGREDIAVTLTNQEVFE